MVSASSATAADTLSGSEELAVTSFPFAVMYSEIVNTLSSPIANSKSTPSLTLTGSIGSAAEVMVTSNVTVTSPHMSETSASPAATAVIVRIFSATAAVATASSDDSAVTGLPFAVI